MPHYCIKNDLMFLIRKCRKIQKNKFDHQTKKKVLEMSLLIYRSDVKPVLSYSFTAIKKVIQEHGTYIN